MFLPNVPGARFIPGYTSIPESRVSAIKLLELKLEDLATYEKSWGAAYEGQKICD